VPRYLISSHFRVSTLKLSCSIHWDEFNSNLYLRLIFGVLTYARMEVLAKPGILGMGFSGEVVERVSARGPRGDLFCSPVNYWPLSPRYSIEIIINSILIPASTNTLLLIFINAFSRINFMTTEKRKVGFYRFKEPFHWFELINIFSVKNFCRKVETFLTCLSLT